MSTGRLMFAALCFAGVLAGCTAEKETVEGKDVHYWAQKAREIQSAVPKSPPQPSLAELQKAQKEVAEKQAEADRVRQEEATRAYVQKLQDQLIAVRESKDGNELVDAAKTALENEVSGGDIVLLGSIYRVREVFMEGILPKRGSTPDDARFVSAEAIERAEKAMRDEIFGWLARSPKRLEVIWPIMRPQLRLQYGLLSTVRTHEQLFKTAYNSTAFESLHECLIWHAEAVYGERREGSRPEKHPEAERCNSVFKKYSVKARFGEEGGQIEKYSARNALYIIRFLARRDANGGEKFAQQFQRLAMDYIKP